MNLDQFFEMIAFLLNKRLPEAHENIEPFGQPVDPDERPSWPSSAELLELALRGRSFESFYVGYQRIDTKPVREEEY